MNFVMSLLRFRDFYQCPKKLECEPFMHDLHGPVWVVDVYDGDTFTIAARMSHWWSPWFLYSVRVRGIDTPEMRTRSVEEKTAAVAARQFAVDTLLNKRVDIRDLGKDKYGRLLADVFVANESYAAMCIARGHAVPYDGGKKQGFVGVASSVEERKE